MCGFLSVVSVGVWYWTRGDWDVSFLLLLPPFSVFLTRFYEIPWGGRVGSVRRRRLDVGRGGRIRGGEIVVGGWRNTSGGGTYSIMEGAFHGLGWAILSV